MFESDIFATLLSGGGKALPARSLTSLSGAGILPVTSAAVVAACDAELAVPANRNACNFFVQAVCKRFGLVAPVAGTANDIATRIGSAPFVLVPTSAQAAATAATDGWIVIAAAAHEGHGHVAIVVPGPVKTFQSGTWPLGYWGALNGHWSGKNNTSFAKGSGPDYINFGFGSEMRRRLRYGALNLPTPAR